MISMMLRLVFPPRRGMTTAATRSDNSVDSTKNVINTKYIGTKNMITTVLLYMRSSAECTRIVLVSSRLGWLNGWKNRNADVALKQQLEDTEYTILSLESSQLVNLILRTSLRRELLRTIGHIEEENYMVLIVAIFEPEETVVLHKPKLVWKSQKITRKESKVRQDMDNNNLENKRVQSLKPQSPPLAIIHRPCIHAIPK
ncbi:hypothetical protein Tco_0086996 [Tanacetum coccineum]